MKRLCEMGTRKQWVYRILVYKKQWEPPVELQLMACGSMVTSRCHHCWYAVKQWGLKPHPSLHQQAWNNTWTNMMGCGELWCDVGHVVLRWALFHYAFLKAFVLFQYWWLSARLWYLQCITVSADALEITQSCTWHWYTDVISTV